MTSGGRNAALITEPSVTSVERDATRGQAAHRGRQSSVWVWTDAAVHPPTFVQQRAFEPSVWLAGGFVHQHGDLRRTGRMTQDFCQFTHGSSRTGTTRMQGNKKVGTGQRLRRSQRRRNGERRRHRLAGRETVSEQ